MKKVLYYAGLFVASFVVQWVWYHQFAAQFNKTPLDMLLASVAFLVILILLDLISPRRMRR
ncbi:hypothetical protein [Sporolactobacillus terrae]|uniref:Uncharacterized protein n=1 Tax=Sporolactobacillus terrae TaxID=269673 RepID=A0A410D7B2_9BACL|nr:hypothetical protein [Sporolactobacillus terrae]QAA22008.1 hypothetical protein C0674_04905 [Sporolactobacillus terrae]QAA24981.1 hypothetical protein C0679_04880 [Sporolactobacillus terrae]UAK16804.1 hypothetical protein K7399_02250 [Sporolactobacillus terrae]BBN98292.1 hypothetical protein St703_09970 [Sporolactobacillus terrae]